MPTAAVTPKPKTRYSENAAEMREKTRFIEELRRIIGPPAERNLTRKMWQTEMFAKASEIFESNPIICEIARRNPELAAKKAVELADCLYRLRK